MKINIDITEDLALDTGEISEDASLKEKVIHALKSVYDPELPVNIYDLGLIYRLQVSDSGMVEIDMTLTSPNCPVAEELPRQAKQAAQDVKGIKAVNLQMVWEPKWDKSRMSEAAQLEAGLF